MDWEFQCSFGALMSPRVAAHDPPCAECFRTYLLWIIAFPEGFFLPYPEGGGRLQDYCFLFVCVCAHRKLGISSGFYGSASVT